MRVAAFLCFRRHVIQRTISANNCLPVDVLGLALLTVQTDR